MMRKGEQLILYLLLAALVLGSIGYFVTPKGQSGQVLVYSPGVKAVQDYKNDAEKWKNEINLTRGKFPEILQSNNLGIYERTQEAQEIFTSLYSLDQEINNSTAPLALQELKGVLLDTTEAYLQAAQSLLQWANSPTEENLQKTNDLLTAADQALSNLENSQWINQ